MSSFFVPEIYPKDEFISLEMTLKWPWNGTTIRHLQILWDVIVSTVVLNTHTSLTSVAVLWLPPFSSRYRTTSRWFSWAAMYKGVNPFYSTQVNTRVYQQTTGLLCLLKQTPPSSLRSCGWWLIQEVKGGCRSKLEEQSPHSSSNGSNFDMLKNMWEQHQLSADWEKLYSCHLYHGANNPPKCSPANMAHLWLWVDVSSSLHQDLHYFSLTRQRGYV